jgi:hypothetical protein
MRPAYQVIFDTNNGLAGFVWQRACKNCLVVEQGIDLSSAGGRLVNSSITQPWPLLKIAFIILSMAMVSACTALQTQENTLEQISTIGDIRYSQLLTNVSLEISDRDSVPSQGLPTNGTATTSATGILGLTLNQPFAFTKNNKTLNPTVMLNWQNNWSISPISDPQDLQNLRALYGLLYLTDAGIAQVVEDTLKTYWADTKRPMDLVIDYFAYVAKEQCGISLKPLGINNPDLAMEAYLNGLKAFPEVFIVETGKPPPRLKTRCYGEVSTFGLVNSSLAYNYGLLYPTIKDVFAAVRNGLSGGCRHYQNQFVVAPKETGLARADRLFERWLFWRDGRGGWAPYDPPETPEYIGTYGNREFWTTSSACLNDFIILAINATANSHAAAQNTQKIGPTPALAQ